MYLYMYVLTSVNLVCPSFQFLLLTTGHFHIMPVIDVLDLTEAGLIQPAKKMHPRVSYTDYSAQLAHVYTQHILYYKQISK